MYKTSFTHKAKHVVGIEMNDRILMYFWFSTMHI